MARDVEDLSESQVCWWYLLVERKRMIFIVLGSQKFQFNRLLKAIDEAKKGGAIQEEIVAQVGYSDYIPESFQTLEFVAKEQFDDYISRSDLVICHGGTGAIISALKKGKKVIALPRLSQYGEHVDDHQLQIVSMFSDLNLIEACLDTDDLVSAINTSRQKNYDSFQSNNAVFLGELKNDIEKITKP